MSMKFTKRVLPVFFALGCLLVADAFADSTIVIVRHGEKPEQGLGQLSCKGLNRSMALASVLLSKYGKPAVIYAPNPAVKKNDKGVAYPYIRPLATIEPTAIRVGLPVNIDYAMADVAPLAETLLARSEGTQFVAWEHHLAAKLAASLLAMAGGDAKTAPSWEDSDFDSVYVVRVSGGGKDRHATFTHENQGLNDLPDTCAQ